MGVEVVLLLGGICALDTGEASLKLTSQHEVSRPLRGCARHTAPELMHCQEVLSHLLLMLGLLIELSLIAVHRPEVFGGTFGDQVATGIFGTAI
jgi:hypothetical protein